MNSQTDFASKVAPRAEAMKTEKPLEPKEARQGRLGRPVLYVLLAALAIAFALWLPLEWWGRTGEPSNPSPAGVSQTAPADSGATAPSN